MRSESRQAAALIALEEERVASASTCNLVGYGK